MQRNLAIVSGAFGPEGLPTWLPRLMAVLVIGAIAVIFAGSFSRVARAPLRRKARGPLAWAMLGAPLEGARAVAHFSGGVWDLLKGGANLKAPADEDLSRRYAELVAENLGQPGFCELILSVHDLDARRDLVFGLVREPFRRTLFPPPAPRAPDARKRSISPASLAITCSISFALR